MGVFTPLATPDTGGLRRDAAELAEEVHAVADGRTLSAEVREVFGCHDDAECREGPGFGDGSAKRGDVPEVGIGDRVAVLAEAEVLHWAPGMTKAPSVSERACRGVGGSWDDLAVNERRGGLTADERRARLIKFVARADRSLQGPIFECRSMQEMGWPFRIRYERVADSDVMRAVGIDLGIPELASDTLDANVLRCRVFILVKEHNYLPTVVSTLRASVGRDRADELRRLKKLVSSRIKGDQLVGAHMYSGRLEADNGLGPGKMLGNDQIAMDYINGQGAHENDAAIARLQNVTTETTVRHAIVSKLHDLMQVVYWTRFEVLRAAADGELDFELPQSVTGGRDALGAVLPASEPGA